MHALEEPWKSKALKVVRDPSGYSQVCWKFKEAALRLLVATYRVLLIVSNTTGRSSSSSSSSSSHVDRSSHCCILLQVTRYLESGLKIGLPPRLVTAYLDVMETVAQVMWYSSIDCTRALKA